MPHPMPADRRALGSTLVFGATVLWSTAGLFVRMLDELDAWKILGWRSVFAALALVVIVLAERKAHEPTADAAPALASWLTVPVAVVSMGAYVTSLTLTSVANVMVVYATVPLVAAGLAWVMLREWPSAAAIVASCLALVGVFIMVGGAVTGSDGLGIFVAFMMTVAMGIQIVLARKFPAMHMSLINMAAAAICAVIGLALAEPGLPSSSQLFILMLFGVSNTALAYYFVLRGARLIPSSETGLISTLDVVLGPLWVWLLFRENPGFYAVVGGLVVLVAVLGYLLANMRSVKQISTGG